MKHWHVGRNIVGYLPESDDGSYPFEEWEDARESLADDIDRWADGLGYDSDGAETALTRQYDASRDEVRAMPGPDVAIDIFLPSSDSDHALDVHFWVTACKEDCEVDND